jgi:hypothetical protein
MAGRKNSLNIDFGVFSDLSEELDKLGADLKEIFTDVMQQEGETVAEDTKEAISKANLPAGGKYSQGDTEKSIVMQPTVEWSGDLGEMGLGFDKTQPGAGGFLITGTPKMQPDYALEQIYGRKSYERKMTEDIMDYLSAEIDSHLKRFN